MAEENIVAKDGRFRIVSLCPDVCLTPSKGHGVPVPYPITHQFDKSVQCSPNVYLQDKAVYLHQESYVDNVKGDEPGEGKGVVSQTNVKISHDIDHSSNVFVNGQAIVRTADQMWMNCLVDWQLYRVMCFVGFASSSVPTDRIDQSKAFASAYRMRNAAFYNPCALQQPAAQEERPLPHQFTEEFKLKKTIAILAALTLVACADKGSVPSTASLPSVGTSGTSSSTENKLSAGLDLFKAATVSDDELKAVSLQLRAAQDKELKMAPAGNKYAQRLARLTKNHASEDGMTLNFKVYLDPTINANATPDGSVRVYSGIMDKMSDPELLGVIGHEIGHVKLGHAAARLRSSYLASASRKAAASSGGAGGALAASELGGLGESLFKAQFSQSQETEADDYGLAFMKKHKYNQKAMESAFRKLASLSTGKSGALDQMFSTHPDSAARADRMRDKIAKG